jgi:hypothetical protein
LRVKDPDAINMQIFPRGMSDDRRYRIFVRCPRSQKLHEALRHSHFLTFRFSLCLRASYMGIWYLVLTAGNHPAFVANSPVPSKKPRLPLGPPHVAEGRLKLSGSPREAKAILGASADSMTRRPTGQDPALVRRQCQKEPRSHVPGRRQASGSSYWPNNMDRR